MVMGGPHLGLLHCRAGAPSPPFLSGAGQGAAFREDLSAGNAFHSNWYYLTGGACLGRHLRKWSEKYSPAHRELETPVLGHAFPQPVSAHGDSLHCLLTPTAESATCLLILRSDGVGWGGCSLFDPPFLPNSLSLGPLAPSCPVVVSRFRLLAVSELCTGTSHKLLVHC